MCRARSFFHTDSYTHISHISCDALEHEQKSSIVSFLVRQRTLFISLHVNLSREDSISQDLKLLPNKVYRITLCEVCELLHFNPTMIWLNHFISCHPNVSGPLIHIIIYLITQASDQKPPSNNMTRQTTGSQSILIGDHSHHILYATWPLACARAAVLAVAETNALLSHLPTTTATPPVTVTPGCASIVPLTHAERPWASVTARCIL
jgi:hypothetical protein